MTKKEVEVAEEVKEEVVEMPPRPKVEYDVWAKEEAIMPEWNDHRVPYLRLFQALGDFFGDLAEVIEDEGALFTQDFEGDPCIEANTTEVLRWFNAVNHQTIWKRGDNGQEYVPINALFSALGSGDYATAQMQFSGLAEIGCKANVKEVLADDLVSHGIEVVDE